jgi:hypothetical protein
MGWAGKEGKSTGTFLEYWNSGMLEKWVKKITKTPMTEISPSP